MPAYDAQWIKHEYLYTYRIASKVQAVAEDPMAYIHDLEALTLDFGIAEFIPNWQKDSALHKFIRYIADGIMDRDNTGSWKIRFGDPTSPKWTIPIEAALVTYGIQEKVEFELTEIPQVYEQRGNITYASDAPEVADACYNHFWELRWTQSYEELLNRMTEEVFFVMFTNRVTLQNLHEYLAEYVIENDYAYIVDEHPELAKYYTKSGRIERRKPPKWARDAVFFRDHGKCTECRRDISGLLDPLSPKNFDHIVPLANGGLNDVSNLQLLCESCNNSKSSRSVPSSNIYRRWY
ncbi:HNH endonuclease [Streptomyces sp. AS02]|uniref:HNH endonuclease n=1 Tax=Streptomyces sp. AS02 TaxID=2938946 RepID=UPI00201FFDB6|nr:HNH endonuclease [Streptomyces sp. AS02]MCL8017687.1 HNH endonuclease [Streptomyces sp. AS02]